MALSRNNKGKEVLWRRKREARREKKNKILALIPI